MPQNGHLIKICLFAQEMMIRESMYESTVCIAISEFYSSVDPDQLAYPDPHCFS